MTTHAKENRLLVCGDRNWDNYKAVKREIKRRMPDVVIEGEANGADLMARMAAEELGIPVEPYPAEWHLYGRAAGPIRNTQMLIRGKPTEVVAFHTDIESSKGTKNMVRQSEKAGIPTTVYKR